METRVVDPDRQVWKELHPGQRGRHTGKTLKKGTKGCELKHIFG